MASSHPVPQLGFDLSDDKLIELNDMMSYWSPQEIITWAIDHLPGLYQTTAFGLTGCAALDMIATLFKSRKVPHLVDVIFIDTLHHFEETIHLCHEATQRVGAQLHMYRPQGASQQAEFQRLHGPSLWQTNPTLYDFVSKVEPARRAYRELGVKAVITGRRRSQGANRAQIPIIELDETNLIKVNPLATWTWEDTLNYVKTHNVPYNTLIDNGYKSVGDAHSTVQSASGDDVDERSGRWSGQEKTECGLHENYFKLKRILGKTEREKEFAERDARRG